MDINERRITLNIGSDATDKDAVFMIHTWLNEDNQDARIWLRLNHVSVELIKIGDHRTAVLPKGVLRSGDNDFTMYCNIESEKGNPVIVNNVFIEVDF